MNNFLKKTKKVINFEAQYTFKFFPTSKKMEEYSEAMKEIEKIENLFNEIQEIIQNNIVIESPDRNKILKILNDI